MTDFATLVLGADTRGLKKGEDALDDIVVAGARAEKATDKTGDAFVRTGKDAQAAAGKVNTFTKATDGARGVAVMAAKSIGAMAGAFLSFQTMSAGITAARAFNAALAETSTLIEGTPQQLEAITAAARSMSKEFGGTATAQVQAFYQTLSAGASSVEEAAANLDAANRLAVGGATDVTTATGILSGVLNSYGKETISATQISDALFVGMKAGVTTVGELSANLGTVIPTAKALGISFDEIVAATAALTKNNMTTSIAVTSLNAAMTAVIKPSKEASDLAKVLGIEFSAAGLQAKGLGGFLAEVATKTGGNVEAMSKLFGSVEALKAALLFAGEAGGQYSEIMVQMGIKTGATAEAFDKMAESLSFRWNAAVAAGGDILLVFGNALLTVAVPALEAAANAAFFMADNVGLIVPVLAGLAATTIPAAVASLASMATGIGLAGLAATAATGAMTALRLAVSIVGGPWGVLAGLVAAAATYLLVFRDNAGEAETAAYDAAAGTAALLGELDTFSKTAAPSAGAAAINLANDNYKLADSAYAAAEAELAKAQAVVKSFAAVAGQGIDPNYELEGAALQGYASDASNKAAMATTALAKAAADLATAQAERVSTAKTVVTSDGAMAKSVEVLGKKVDVTVNSLGDLGGGGGGTAAKGAAGKAADALTDAEKAAKKLKDELDAPMISAIDGVANAFGDFIAGGLKDFGGFVKSIINSFKQMLSQMIAMAVKNKIMIGLGLSAPTGSLASTAASVVGGGGAAGGSGALSSLGGIGGAFSSFLGSWGSAGAAGTGLLGGASSVFSGLASGGLSGGIGAIGTALGGATSGIAGIGAALGAVAVPLLAIVGIVSFFKKKTEELDSGVRVTTTGMSALVDQFNVIKTTRFWGLSKKISVNYSAAAASIADPIKKALADIQVGVLQTADILGVGDTAFQNFSHMFQVHTKGLSEADAQKAIQEAFSGFGDAFASMIPGLAALQKDGEGANAALQRLALSLASVNDVFDLLGETLYSASLASGDLASTIVDAFGGLDAMNSAVSTYWQNFYSVEERLAISTRRLTTTMEGLGVQLPESREAFRDMVESMDTSTKEGATLYAQLISLSGAFAEITAPIETAAQAIKDFIKSILGDMDLMPTSRNQFDARGNIRLDDAFAAAQSGDMEATRKYLTDIRAASGSDMAYREVAAKVLAQFGSGVPAFAAGGAHTGGLRVVGENGPEIEATGPSRIYSNGQSQSLFDSGGVVGELQAIRSEVRGMRDETRQLGLRADKHAKGTADALEKWDKIGLPAGNGGEW